MQSKSKNKAPKIEPDVLASLLDMSPASITIHDTKGNFIYANETTFKLHGFSREEFFKLNLRRLDSPESARLIKHRIGELLRDGEASFEAEHYRKDKTLLPLHVFTKIIDLHNKKIIMSVALDNTERATFLRKIQDYNNFINQILANAFEGITIIDATGKVMYESPAVNHILGYSLTERKDGNAFSNVHPDDMPTVQAAFKEILEKQQESMQCILRIRHKNGTWRWMECYGRNLVNDPSINGILVNYRDITERKKEEEVRLKLQEQVQQIQKLESLGTLAAGIAHDFNNLLAGIFGFIDMARTLSKDPKITEHLNASLKTMNRARGLTQQLLTFAKGGAPIAKTADLRVFVRDTVEFALSGSNVSPVFDIPDDLWFCDCDTTQIGQVIDNLVINAQQAMPLGGVIDVNLKNQVIEPLEHMLLAPGRYVNMSIRDSGVGIPKDIMGRIFEPFFTTKQKGSGLGLATCYSIIKKHNGFIEAESEPGRGSIFHVYLPASHQIAEKSDLQPVEDFKGTGKILIMDDEQVVRESMDAMLAHHGFTTSLTSNGHEALRLFDESIEKKEPFSAMFLDLTIPGGIGGKEAIAEIRKKDTRIPVIVSSGYGEDPIISNPKYYGFTDSIKKPFTREELMRVLTKYITPD